MTNNKKLFNPLIVFIFWFLSLAIIFLIGISNVLADTVPATLTYSSNVEQQLYNTGGDNWISCTNNSCPLWNSNKSGVPSWLSYTFNSSLKSGYTYFFDISIQFDYVNNSNTSIPVWKLSNYVNAGDNYSARINRDMISCSNAQLSISNNREIATWNCSFSPKQDYSNFEFNLWTNKIYNSLSQNGVFMPYNSSTYKLNYYKLSYLDTSTGTLITQNQQIIEQQKEQIETSKGILGKIKDLFNWFTNDDESGATNSAVDFFSGFTTDTFGLTSIITAPLNLIGSITSSTCSPLGLPLPYVNKTLELPCMSSIYSQYFGSFFTMYQTITYGIISYWVIVRIFNLVKDFKNPDHDEIEVLDL